MYAVDGIFLTSVPFLFPLECRGAYGQCLSLAFSTRPYNAGFLPIPAGLLFLGAAIARINNNEPAKVFASGLFALQASIVGLWFAVTRVPDLPLILHRASGSNAPTFLPFFHLLLLAATFFPLIFTAGWAVRDLLSKETVRVVFRRGAAGCSFLALVPMFLSSYGQPAPSSGDPISYFLFAAYLWGLLSASAAQISSLDRWHYLVSLRRPGGFFLDRSRLLRLLLRDQAPHRSPRRFLHQPVFTGDDHRRLAAADVFLKSSGSISFGFRGIVRPATFRRAHHF
jgi:hypothetical protein